MMPNPVDEMIRRAARPRPRRRQAQDTPAPVDGTAGDGAHTVDREPTTAEVMDAAIRYASRRR
jgi:anthranilate phosphoribosyltransferase